MWGKSKTVLRATFMSSLITFACASLILAGAVASLAQQESDNCYYMTSLVAADGANH